MKLSQALKGISLDLRQTENTYEDSQTGIVYLLLSEEFKGQDHLVMSKTSAETLLAKPEEERMAFLASCEVTYSEDAECYGIVMPQSTKSLGTITF